MVRPTSTERVAATGRSSSVEPATVHSASTKASSDLLFRPRVGDSTASGSSDEERRAVASESSWEEVGAPAGSEGTCPGSMSGADTGKIPDEHPALIEARVDGNCSEAAKSSAAEDSSDSPVDAHGTTADTLCASMEDTAISTAKRSHDDSQIQTSAMPTAPLASNANLSLAERQRLQREAQQAFLRSKGLGASSAGGAGAISPVVREGFVVHRDVSGKIANLRNAVQKKTSNIGAGSAASASISRTGSTVSGSNDTIAIGEQRNANVTSAPREHGKDDTASEATAYPPYPVYPQTMIALGYKLGDPRDKEGGSADAMSSMLKGARKAGVAVTGGAMVAVGAVLTPLPTPGGILIAGAGLGVLSTEFEGAKKVMDKGRDKLVDLIDSIDDDKKEKKAEAEAATTQTGEANIVSECDEEDGAQGRHGSDTRTSSAGCSRRGSEMSSQTETTEGSIPSASVASAPSTSTRSFRGGLSRIGKSIRPLLTDDEAPRRAMDELKTKSERRMNEMKSSTQRTYMKMRSHLNTVVDQLALPDNEALGRHDFAAAPYDKAAESSITAATESKTNEVPTAKEGDDGATTNISGDEALR